MELGGFSESRFVLAFHNFRRSLHPVLVSQCVPLRMFTLHTEHARTCVNFEPADPAKILKNLNFTLPISFIFV